MVSFQIIIAFVNKANVTGEKNNATIFKMATVCVCVCVCVCACVCVCMCTTLDQILQIYNAHPNNNWTPV